MNIDLIQIHICIREIPDTKYGCFADTAKLVYINCMDINCDNCPCSIEAYYKNYIDYGHKLLHIPVREL